MTAHIDTLKEWWENAEVGDPKDGDVIIEWAGDGHAVRTFLEAERDDLYAACTYRILARAPKPKPAWHDAPAVIATYRDERGMVSGAWVREGKPGYWEGPEGDVVASEALEDVVPLIEAKVTDEMVERATRAVINWEYRPRLDTIITLDLGDKGSRALVNNVLTAALGLETE